MIKPHIEDTLYERGLIDKPKKSMTLKELEIAVKEKAYRRIREEYELQKRLAACFHNPDLMRG